MKTVMKKMFCLLLVAVMLVGVMPFAAFASETKHCDTCNADGHEETDAHCTSCSNQYGHLATDTHCVECHWYGAHDPNCTYGCNESATCNWDHKHKATCLSTATCAYCGMEKDHFSANCPTTCSSCSNQRGHDELDPHCTECHWYGAHDPNCTSGCNESATCDWDHKHKATCETLKCTHCGAPGTHLSTDCPELCQTCKAAGTYTIAHDADDHCEHCDVAPGTAADKHAITCSVNPNFYTDCGKCGIEYITSNGHPDCDICDNKNASASNPCHSTADCPYCKVCWDKGDQVKAHKTADHCPKCGNTDGTHKTTCEKAVCSICNGAHDAANCPNDGDYDLKIYATMWTGDGREETVYLGTFYNLSTSTKISEYMDDNSDRIDDWVAAKCSGYGWNDRKIYEDKWSTDQIEWNDRMGYSDQEAYINVKRDSKDVVLFLHTARTYVDHDWIKVEGKTTDDTLTLEEAEKLVKKYYNFSSLKMYSNDRWNEYVDGNNNINSQKAVTIGSDNVTKIHVLMSGSSAKTSSGTSSSSKADSSNPKTGDTIYAPIMVMGASVSALAVLFYLNKKRAY